MILKQALIKSVNAIAAQLVARVGPEAVVDVARRCGITSPLAPVYSLSLGTSGVSPLEMAAAFATFATGGVQHKPFWIRRVEDPLGRVLEEHIVRGQRSLDAGIGYQVVDMMRDVLNTGTGRVIRRKGFDLPAAGKTGTTDDFRDAWFTGFTPTLSVCVWVGYDRGASMRDVNGVGITGGRGAAPIWADFMIKATSGEPAREFIVPSDIHFAAVDPINGAVAAQWTKNPVKVALRSGQDASAVPVQPNETATGSPVFQTPDEITIQKGDEPATQTVEKPDVVESADDSMIKEEELPPE
jgi:penicillin-binding protein 1A